MGTRVRSFSMTVRSTSLMNETDGPGRSSKSATARMASKYLFFGSI